MVGVELVLEVGDRDGVLFGACFDVLAIDTLSVIGFEVFEGDGVAWIGAVVVDGVAVE